MEFFKVLLPEIITVATGLRMAVRIVRRGDSLRELASWFPTVMVAVAWAFCVFPEK